MAYTPGDSVTVTYDVALVAEPRASEPSDYHRVTGAVTVRSVDELGCGCTRLRTDRPGDACSNAMEILTGCQTHTSEI